MTPALCRFLKRTIDIGLALVGLLVILPVICLVALIALVVQGRPVFYVSRRYISRERAVDIYKFRSMVKDARSEKYNLHQYMKNGYLDVPTDNEVYTPLGRILERTQIVELPQIYNVLFDGMSLVGNRALPKENLESLNVFPGWEKRFDSPSGLTGISQVIGKMNLTPEDRINIECLYSDVYNNGNVLKCDFFIAVATVKLILLNSCLAYEDAVALLKSCY